MNMNPQSPLPDADLRARCSAYLLGELDEQASSELEAQLDNPVVAQAMEAESDFLIRLTSSPMLSGAVAGEPTLAPERHSRVSPRQLSVLVSALAATLIFAAFYASSVDEGSPRQSSKATVAMTETAPAENSYELRLARTWVEPAVDWNVEQESDAFGGEVDTDLTHTAPADAAAEASDEESFEWLIAAVQVSMTTDDQRATGDPNDG